MSNKRGQGLSTNAIILIVLGVFVLAILILGFTLGWGKIAPWISTNNVKDVVTSCSVACSTNSQFDFCSSKRELKADDVKLEDVTCNYLGQKQPLYGVGVCSTVSCDNVVLVDLSGGEELDVSMCEGNVGKILQGMVDNRLVSLSCDATVSQ